ncbi:MAG: DUF2169 domain-containing protein [Polyangiales bacterium]
MALKDASIELSTRPDMKTIKPQRLGFLCRSHEHHRQHRLVCAVVAFVDFNRPDLPLSEVDLWKTVGAELGGAPLDEVLPKRRGELLLDAKAFPPGPRPASACVVRAAIGKIDKRLGVVGDRFWETLSREPIPFSEMPLSYARAFGGDGYAANPGGKGIHPIATANGPLHPLPNIEDPNRLVRGPADRPPPAGFGPYDLSWPQRASKAGTSDRKWFEELFPGLASDVDESMFNMAPEDQQLDGFFVGDEAFTLENMHPDKPVIRSRLPGLRARCFVHQRAASVTALREVEMRLDTVRLIPHVERAIVIFRGVVDVAEDDAADVLQVMIACEDLGAPRPVEHYREVFHRRLDPKHGFLYSLQDHELLPPRLRESLQAASSAPDPSHPVVGEGHLAKNFRQRAVDEVAKINQDLAARGLPTQHLDAIASPAAPAAFDPEAVAQLMDDALAQAERAKQDAMKRANEARAQARARFAELGIDEEAAQLMKGKTGGPPEFRADAELAALATTATSARRRNAPMLDLERKLADPAFTERLRRAEQAQTDVYRRFAHLQAAAAGRPRKELREARARAEVALAARQSLATHDFTCADLTGLDFRGADLRGAFLDGCVLRGVDLSGSQLEGAVLARAQLAGARLDGARLTSANLGAADLEGASFDGADLSGAVLADANLRRTRLRQANLLGADLMGAKLDQTDLAGAVLADLVFLRVTMRDVSFDGADLRKTIFLESSVERVDFSRANMTSAVFLATRFERPVFRGADLTNLRVVGASFLEDGDFREANLTGANLRGVQLARSDFTAATLTGADFSEADLRDCNLSRVRARGARFVRSQASNASFEVADLMDAVLDKAVLLAANLSHANLFQADLARVRLDTATRFDGANLKRARLRPGART